MAFLKLNIVVENVITVYRIRPVTRILCGGVLTRPKWTKLLKWISSSKETVMLRRWGRSKQKFGFIKQVDKC